MFQSLVCGNQLQHEDLRNNIFWFQPNLRLYNTCKVEVPKWGQPIKTLVFFVNLDDMFMMDDKVPKIYRVCIYTNFFI